MRILRIRENLDQHRCGNRTSRPPLIRMTGKPAPGALIQGTFRPHQCDEHASIEQVRAALKLILQQPLHVLSRDLWQLSGRTTLQSRQSFPSGQQHSLHKSASGVKLMPIPCELCNRRVTSYTCPGLRRSALPDTFATLRQSPGPTYWPPA